MHSMYFEEIIIIRHKNWNSRLVFVKAFNMTWCLAMFFFLPDNSLLHDILSLNFSADQGISRSDAGQTSSGRSAPLSNERGGVVWKMSSWQMSRVKMYCDSTVWRHLAQLRKGRTHHYTCTGFLKQSCGNITLLLGKGRWPNEKVIEMI